MVKSQLSRTLSVLLVIVMLVTQAGVIALAQSAAGTLPVYTGEKTAAEELEEVKELLSALRLIFRDGLLIKLQGAKADRNLLLKAEKERSISVSKAYTKRALVYAQEAISEGEKQVKFNAAFPQCIELCMAKIQRENK